MRRALQAWKVASLGRSAPVMLVFSRLPQFSKELRPQIGQQANQVKISLEAAFGQKAELLRQAELKRSMEHDRLDVTLPGRRPGAWAAFHPDPDPARDLPGLWRYGLPDLPLSGCRDGRE